MRRKLVRRGRLGASIMNPQANGLWNQGVFRSRRWEQWPGPIGMASPRPVSSIKEKNLCLFVMCRGVFVRTCAKHTHSTHVEV